MKELTPYEMEDILLAHEKAELEYDVDATMATLVANPHYEIATIGVAIDGWDTVHRMYQRLVKLGAEGRNIQARARVIAFARNTLVREAHVSFDTPEGKRVTGLYLVVLEFDPEKKKIIGERMYTDPIFGKLLTDILGEDLATLPGVSKIADSAPVINVHDAYELAAARGVTIERPKASAS
jgi:hypothetical protein